MTNDEHSGDAGSLSVYSDDRVEIFDLAAAGRLTGMHRELIVEFTRAHLVPVSPATIDPAEPVFDERGLCRLRQIVELQERHKVPLRMVRLIVRLLDRLEENEEELRVLRERR